MRISRKARRNIQLYRGKCGVTLDDVRRIVAEPTTVRVQADGREQRFGYIGPQVVRIVIDPVTETVISVHPRRRLP